VRDDVGRLGDPAQPGRQVLDLAVEPVARPGAGSGPAAASVRHEDRPLGRDRLGDRPPGLGVGHHAVHDDDR